MLSFEFSYKPILEMVSRHAKKRAQAKKNAAAAKARSGKESSTTNPESDVGHNSSPVQLDGGRVARLDACPGVEALQFPLGGSTRGVRERNVSQATSQTVCGHRPRA